MKNRYYNPQTNIFDFLNKNARTNKQYDRIWQSVQKCVFCDLKERYIIFEKNGIVLIANLFPYTDAHLLIVPRRHIEAVKELNSTEWETVKAFMYVSRKLLKKIFKVKNIWFIYRDGALGEGQKTVGHLHIQVVPYVKDLFKINYQPISWAPAEVSGKLKEQIKYSEKKYQKYLEKYGKFAEAERKIVVNALIINNKKEIVLVKKKYSTFPNSWATPSGCLERNESLETALKREIYEETKLKIKKIKFLSIFEAEQTVLFEEGYKKKWSMIFINYLVKIHKCPNLVAGDDAIEAKWVKLSELKNFKLTNITKKVIKAYKKQS